MRDIIGTWRLVMTRARNDAGEPMHAPYGPNPMGVVVFSADRRMMAVLCDGRAVLPEGEPEREYSSYCGNYTFDGTTLVTRRCVLRPQPYRRRPGATGSLRRRSSRTDAAAAPVARPDAAPRAVLGTGWVTRPATGAE